MSETSTGLSKVGPDYFTFYTREVKDLVSQHEEFLPFGAKLTESGNGDVKDKVSDPLFKHGIGAALSDNRKERLNALLRQAVEALTPEVDEMLDPVVDMRRLQSQIRSKKIASDNTGPITNDDVGEVPSKKLKMSPSFSSTSITGPASLVHHGSCTECLASGCTDSKVLNVDQPGKGVANDVQKNCARCNTSITPECEVGPEGKFLCTACGIGAKNGSESCSGSTPVAENENNEGDDDLQFLLENDSSIVEETMKQYSDKLFATLDHMETHLESLLDVIMSTCRSMTMAEKQTLKKLIQKLPPKNLDRVAEIVQCRKPVGGQYCDEIFVDLEQEDNVTLWRLYFYAEAVEKARNLSVMFTSDANTL